MICKQVFAINLQAVCDHNILFTDVFSGFPGGSHDAYMFRWSDLFVEEPTEIAKLFSSTQFHIVGDGAYPLMSYLLRPTQNKSNLPQHMNRYNRALSSYWQLIERAFGLLKGKWKLLYRGIETGDYLKVSMIATTCCVLHNFCILKGDAPIVEDLPDVPDGFEIPAPNLEADDDEEMALQTQEMAQIWLAYGTEGKAKENHLAL